MFSLRAVSGCRNTDIEIHHLKKLCRKVEKDGKISVLNRKSRRVKGSRAILSAMGRKQLPLCKMHHLAFECGVFSDLDPFYLKEVYNIKVPENNVLREVFTTGELNINK